MTVSWVLNSPLEEHSLGEMLWLCLYASSHVSNIDVEARA